MAATHDAATADQQENPANSAQEPQDREAAAASGDIVVTAARSAASVISDIPADQVLDADAIASYGASNAADLVAALTVQTNAGRGRGSSGMPVMLVNGRRVSGFGEIRNLPPEAIQRVEIFPAEVALDYGYAADQRVINFILKDHFSAVTTELEGGGSTGGGRWTQNAEASMLRLSGKTRLDLSAQYQRATALTEADRQLTQATRAIPLTTGGVVSGMGGGEIDPALSAAAGSLVTQVAVPGGGTSLGNFTGNIGAIPALGEGQFRTLLPATQEWTLAGTYALPITEQIGASLNLRYDIYDAQAMNGLPSATLLVPAGNAASPFSQAVLLTRAYGQNGALANDTHRETLHAGSSSDGRIGRWRWNLTGNFDRVVTNVTSDRGPDFAALQAAINAGANPFAADPSALITLLTPDNTRAVSQSGDSTILLSGPLFDLPAGRVRMTMQGGFARHDYTGQSFRSGITTLTDLGRSTWNGSANIDVPISERNGDALPWLGNLSINGRYALADLSDFGRLTSWTAGATWSPLGRVDVVASWTGNSNAPDIASLGAPLLVTPLVSVYDYTRGESVLANVTTGGNAALLAEKRKDFTLTTSWRPIPDTDLMVTATYARVRSSNTTSSLPALTPEIEAAFPGRITRDNAGQIIAVDQRAVNFAQTAGRQIRYGLSYSRSFGQAAGGRGFGGMGAGPGGPRTGGAGGGMRGPGGGGLGRMMGGPGAGGRWSLSLFDTVKLQDIVLIRSGVPMLDLLNGSATGASGGTSRHTVEFEGGWFNRGIGFRANGSWASGTRVIGGPVAGGGTASDLTFSPLFTVNLRAFVDLNQQTKLVHSFPFFRNARMRLAVDNLFGSIRDVRDANGLVPLRYQAGYVDPAGRTVSLELRKQF